jgi:hypothetical protein
MEQQLKQLKELASRALFSAHVVLHMNDEGKAYHCHNKIVGLIDQLTLLSQKASELETLTGPIEARPLELAGVGRKCLIVEELPNSGKTKSST